MSKTVGSSIAVSALSALVVGFSFLNQIVIAGTFGTGIAMDGYLAAVSVPSLVMGAITGVFSYAVVPVLVKWKHDRQDYRHSVGGLLLTVLSSAAAVWLIGQVSTPLLARIASQQYLSTMHNDITLILRISWCTTAIGMLTGYLSALHFANGSFALPTVCSIAPYGAMIVGGLAGHATIGISVLAWAMLAGYLIAAAGLLPRAIQECCVSGMSLYKWRDPWEVTSRMPVVWLSLLCFTAYPVSDAYWATRIGPGGLSYLGYCHRILIAIGAVVAAGPTTVVLARISAWAADGKLDRLASDTLFAIRTIIAWTIPLTLVITSLRVPIVRLALQRGAFDAASAAGVTSVLPGMLVGMVAMLGTTMSFKALHARGDRGSAALLGFAGASAYFVCSGLLASRFGLSGIVFAYVVSWWALFAASVQRCTRLPFTRLLGDANRRFLGRCALALVAEWAVAEAGVMLLHPAAQTHGFPQMLSCALIAASAVGTYLFVGARLLVIEELALVLRHVLYNSERRSGQSAVVRSSPPCK